MAEIGEAERFFESLADSFDTTNPLRWNFLLSGLSVDQVGPLMDEVEGLGFTEVEPLADEEQAERFLLWFAEVRVHSAVSFAERVAVVEHLAGREGLVVSDFSAGRFE